jgi:hypothetical protein
MSKNTKKHIICIITLMLISFAAFAAPASAAGAITLTPSGHVTTGGSVTVSGTGFIPSTSIGIVLGTEIVVTNEAAPTPTGTGMGPYTSRVAHYPIKPGSFSMHWDTAGTASDWTDNGDGSMSSETAYNAGTTLNYATGVFGRSSTVDLSTYALTATVAYTYYQYNVTTVGGVTSNGAGGFTASITVPTVANGVYTVTAVDANGTKATASLGVGVDVPEGFTVGIVVLLTSVAVIGSAILLRKPKTTNIKMGKL